MGHFASDIKRGLFIVLEGCDRCGKSTQSRMLTEFLEKRRVPVKHMSFPARETETGGIIDSYLRKKNDLPDEAIHLLFTANRWEAINNMQKLLQSGTTLVVDRYSYSGVAYSVAKGLNFDWCWSPEKGLLRPDIVFYLNAPLKKLTLRGDYGKERYEKLEFQEKVSNIFKSIYQKEKHYWHEIDAASTKDEVHKEIVNVTLQRLSELQSNSLNTL